MLRSLIERYKEWSKIHAMKSVIREALSAMQSQQRLHGRFTDEQAEAAMVFWFGKYKEAGGESRKAFEWHLRMNDFLGG